MNTGDILLKFISLGYEGLIDKADTLLPAFKTTYASLLLCSILFYGVLIMHGTVATSGKEFLKTCVWALVASSCLSTSFYEFAITEPISEVKDNLAIFLAPGTGSTVFESVQSSFAGLMKHGMKLIDSGSIMTNLMPIVIGATVMIAAGLYYLAILANLLFCELVLHVFYFLGVFIIPLGAFKSARPMVSAWVKAIAKYCLVFVITGAVVGLIDSAMMPLLQEVIDQSYQEGGYGKGISPIYLTCVISLSFFGAYLMSKVMEFSAELTGGVMSDGATGAKSISNGMKNTVGALNTVSSGVGGGVRALKAKMANGQ